MKLKQIKALGADIIISANKTTMTKSGVIVPESSTLKPVQEVLNVGPYVRNVEVGDIIEINPASFPVNRKPPKNGIGPDIETPILPLYEDEDDVAFMKILESNILWGIVKDELDVQK